MHDLEEVGQHSVGKRPFRLSVVEMFSASLSVESIRSASLRGPASPAASTARVLTPVVTVTTGKLPT